MTDQSVALRATSEITEYRPRTAKEIREQVNLIQDVMKEVMQKDEHYGIVPGTTKPTLLKPGAEKLCLTFRLDPQYEITERHDGMHLTVVSRCTLFSIPTGQRLGSGMGSCSTRETKYAYRLAARRCPACGQESIIKGKAEYGGGWLCYAKKGGCGAKFQAQDPAIEEQIVGRVPNEDVADQWNTVLKVSNKRSLVAAVLNVTAASDSFIQDMEDATDGEAKPVETTVTASAPANATSAPAPAKPSNGPAAPIQPPQRKAPTSGLTDSRAALWERVLAHTNGNEEAARAFLYDLTSFQNDKGETVPGKRDVAGLSEKWAASSLKKLDRLSQEDLDHLAQEAGDVF